MKRIWRETQRVAADVLLWVMVAAALGINSCLIFCDRTPISLYLETEAAIAAVGTEITEDAVDALEVVCAGILEKANQSYQQRFGETTEDIQNLYELNYLDETEYYRLRVWQSLAAVGHSRLSEGTAQPEGTAEQQKSAEASGEFLFFNAAQTTPLKEQVYGTLLPTIYLETLGIAAYVIFRSKEREYVFRTYRIVYSTGRGKLLERDKQMACSCVITGIFILVAAPSLLGFFCRYPHPSTLAAPYAAQVYPRMIVKLSASGLQFLMLNLLIMLWVIQIIALIAGGIGILTKNSYMSLLLFLLFTGCLAVCQWLCRDGVNLWDLVLSWNPISLLLTIRQTEEGAPEIQFRLGEMFCYSEECYGVRFYEVGVLLSWSVASVTFYALASKNFQRRELSE